MTEVTLKAPISPTHEDNSRRSEELPDAKESFEKLAETYKSDVKFSVESSHSIIYEFFGPDGYEQLIGPQNYHVIESNLLSVDDSLQKEAEPPQHTGNESVSQETSIYSHSDNFETNKASIESHGENPPRYCTKCSAKIRKPKKSNFCPGCGTRL